MADQKITDLALVDEITESLNFPVDDTLQTYRATIAQVKAYLAPVYVPPSIERFTNTGSSTLNKHYTFLCGSASATVGATYTNNGVTYTVIRTIASKTQVVLSGNGAPTASGTLTKASGTGDSTITFTVVREPIAMKLYVIGAGGGGGGGGKNNGGTGGSPAATTVGSIVSCAAGVGGAGTTQAQGGGGGSPSVSSPALIIRAFNGGQGGANTEGAVANIYHSPGMGGGSFYGGGGGNAAAATNAPGNLVIGSGGGGGSGPNTSDGIPGAGGGAGSYAECIVYGADIASSYAISIAGGGAGGTAGTSGNTGGAGNRGEVTAEFIYQ